MTPTSLQDLTISQYHAYLGATAEAAETLPATLSKASQMIIETLLSDGKLLVCGEGLHSINALQFCTRLNCSSTQEQPILPVINLCADSYLSNAMQPIVPAQNFYARQIDALGLNNDILIVFYNLDESDNIKQAIKSAHNQSIKVILIGSQLNKLQPSHIQDSDISIDAPGDTLDTILQQQHAATLLLSHLVKTQLFGSQHPNA